MFRNRGKKGTFHHRARNTKKHGNNPLFDQIDDWLRMYMEDAFASVEVQEDTEDEPEEPVEDEKKGWRHMSGMATHIAWRALQLFRALCFAIFLLSALLVVIVLSDFKVVHQDNPCTSNHRLRSSPSWFGFSFGDSIRKIILESLLLLLLKTPSASTQTLQLEVRRLHRNS